MIFELHLLIGICEAETRDNIIFVRYNTALQYNMQLFYSLSHEYKMPYACDSNFGRCKHIIAAFSHYSVSSLSNFLGNTIIIHNPI